MTGEAANLIDPVSFRRNLLAHFDRNRRALPWRHGRTPYAVMVSEFMLQQTRVEAVVPYYHRWLARFPDWHTLADATDDEVILAWKGLGYYRRARNLHATARVVCERYAGRLPERPDELLILPGVGRYTAGAVASIAFGKVAPAVDGNVRRVLSRLLDVGDLKPARLRDEATRLIDPDRPGDFNEALMELGATVCTPRSPRCGDCPVADDCGALAGGTIAERPTPAPRKRIPTAEYTVAVVVAGARVVPQPQVVAEPQVVAPPLTLLVKRPPTGLLAGMWEFPTMDTLADIGFAGTPGPPLDPVKHTFTHLRATYRPVIVHLPRPLNHGNARHAQNSRRPQTPQRPQAHAWIHPDHLDEWALPVAQQKIAARLRDWLRGNRPRASG